MCALADKFMPTLMNQVDNIWKKPWNKLQYWNAKGKIETTASETSMRLAASRNYDLKQES